MRGVKWLIASANPGQALGRYEPIQEGVISDLLKRSEYFWDVGAHVGWYTLMANKLMPTSGKIFSFEPNPHNVALLETNISLNRPSRIFVLQQAISDKSGSAIFTGASQTGRLNPSTQQDQVSVTVKTNSLDKLVEELGHTPDLIKMDIEGAELKALEGAGSLLSSGDTTFVLSAHGWQLKDACVDLLSKYRYDTSMLISNQDDGDYLILCKPPKNP